MTLKKRLINVLVFIKVHKKPCLVKNFEFVLKHYIVSKWSLSKPKSKMFRSFELYQMKLLHVLTYFQYLKIRWGEYLVFLTWKIKIELYWELILKYSTLMIYIKYSRLHVSAHAYIKKSNSIYNMNSMLILSESSRPLHRNQRSIGYL